PGCDLLDKPRHVDVRRACIRARRVETIQTPVGLRERRRPGQRRMNLSEPRGYFIGRVNGRVDHRAALTTAAPHCEKLASRRRVNSSTSEREIFIGGDRRSTFPYKPPLPSRIRLSRAASITRTVACAA